MTLDTEAVFLSIYGAKFTLDLFLAWLLFRFYKSHGHRYLRHWGLSWTALAVHHGFAGVSYWLIGTVPATSVIRVLLATAYLIAAYLQVWWLLEGAHEVQTERSIPAKWRRWSFGAIVVFSATVVFLTMDGGRELMLLARTGLYSVISGAAFMVSAFGIYRTGWRGEIGRPIFAVSLFFYGVLSIYSFLPNLGPVVASLPSWALSIEALVWHDLVDLLLHAGLGVAVVIWLLEDERDRAQRSEAASRQTQRLEAVGRLAGGIAHDFNNLLTVILGYCGLMRNSAPRRTSSHDAMDEIEKAAETAARLTGQLLAFSRKQVMNPRVISLNDVVADNEEMLRRLVTENIKLVFEPGPEELPAIQADPAQIQQVLMNLVINARDAMPSGGTLTVATARKELVEEGEWQGPSFSLGVKATLSVQDSGTGMDSTTRERLFEPFFTTKPQGEGTGLGLATVYGIVSQSHGGVRVQSRLGEGSRFEVCFPAVDGVPLSLPRPSPQPRFEGSETILLVEDDEGVRSYVAEALKAKGYEVLLAESPNHALELAEQSASLVELLVTDVVMPQMDGNELTRRLRERQPSLPVLFMSGYLNESLELDGPLLEKPFGSAALLSRVREILVKNETAKHA